MLNIGTDTKNILELLNSCNSLVLVDKFTISFIYTNYRAIYIIEILLYLCEIGIFPSRSKLLWDSGFGSEIGMVDSLVLVLLTHYFFYLLPIFYKHLLGLSD